MAVFKFRNLNTSQATPIPPGEFTVGRGDDTYVHVEDTSVSRRHARLFNREEGFFVEDAGSVNGTAAHGAFLTGRVKIDFGDVVHIGSVPFRVDHEVAGEITHAPSAGLRAVKRAYMARDTERIPAIGESARLVQKFSSEKLSAPEIPLASDSEAGELNAITLREPTAPVAARLPLVRPGTRETPQGVPAQPVFPVPTPQNLAPVRPPPEEKASTALPRETVGAPDVSPEQPGTGRSWGWIILVFLAGMGTGLLLGLYFAKLFLDLGGKAASLP